MLVGGRIFTSVNTIKITGDYGGRKVRIPDESIRKFQILYRQAFGEETSAERAQAEGLALMRLAAIREEQKLRKLQGQEKGAKK
jgi:hypothetical protein